MPGKSIAVRWSIRNFVPPSGSGGGEKTFSHVFGEVEASPFARPAHPVIPPEEFDQAELLAIEKEAIGLFISAHPLKEVREALRAAVDAPLASLPDHKDGDWVTAGGIITQAKKIRTRNGEPMMFATLDDLEGSVEILVFGKALEAYGGELGVDQVVLVRGRVDHKDANKVCIVVQDVTRFDPSEAEIEKAKAAMAERAALEQPRWLRMRVDAARLEATIIAELRELFERYPGKDDFELEMQTRAGLRRLRFGGAYRIAARNGALKSELRSLLGDAIVAQPPAEAALAPPEPEPAVA